MATRIVHIESLFLKNRKGILTQGFHIDIIGVDMVRKNKAKLGYIRAGLLIGIIAQKEETGKIVDLRPSVIYETDKAKKQLIAAQTEPPLTRQEVGGTLELTFLSESKGHAGYSSEHTRYGFSSQLLNIDEEYILGGGNTVENLLFSYPDHIYERSLRSYMRFRPILDHNIYIEKIGNTKHFLKPIKAVVVDISLSGLRISFLLGRNLKLRKGKSLFVKLSTQDGRYILVKTTVVWIRSTDKKKGIYEMGLEFSPLTLQEDGFISKYIVKLERIELQRRAGIS